MIQPTDDPEWLEKSNAPVAWNTANLHIHYATALEEASRAAAAMLANVDLDTDTVSAMTYALVVDKAGSGRVRRQMGRRERRPVDGWLQ